MFDDCEYVDVDLLNPIEKDIVLPRFNDLYLILPGRWKDDPIDWPAGVLYVGIFSSEFSSTALIEKTNADFVFRKTDDTLTQDDIAELIIDRQSDMEGVLKLGTEYYMVFTYQHPDPQIDGTVFRGTLKRDFK